MSQYAIYEVNKLVKSLSSPSVDKSSIVRYLCALFAELAYYHIPQWEIDGNKRAKLIPCETYQTLVMHGQSIDLNTRFLELDLPKGFAVANRGVVAVGLVLNRLSFIGFRGTQFLFDWRVNLCSKLVPIDASSTVSSRFHSGFAKEAARISELILDAIRALNLGDVNHIYLTGHSLGGAVAAISKNFLKIGSTSVCILGTPRYANSSVYKSISFGQLTHVRRSGDIVPTVPPKFFGYADHPNELRTNGKKYTDPSLYSSSFGGFVRWVQFLLGRFQPHKIEAYRNELGGTAGAQGAKAPLVPVKKLTTTDIEPAIA
ncbi:lipase family protein [Zooshikella harenae]|uniref:Lipase family protein n=1 Tax=Zooshikella harenae TaxID=2827238 RepID=A0ABS5ZIA7_9GAMM|nr:lipase family protein [Zooshikella harenae]MBU2713809.1 lipase family protein [Zooshikella harenae]